MAHSFTNRDGSRTYWYDFDQTVNWMGVRVVAIDAWFLKHSSDLRQVLDVMGYTLAAAGTSPEGWRVAYFHKPAKLPPRRR